VEFLVVGELSRGRTGALAEFLNFLGILVDFLCVWDGLGPICNWFSKVRGPSAIFIDTWGLWVDLQTSQGLNFKMVRNKEFPYLFSNGKLHGPSP
jgi:hypothetical protein